MRVANPRLIRLAGLAKGAIVERGDGELIVSPLIQPVIELVSPVSRTFGVGQAVPVGNLDDSIVKGVSDNISGAAAANVVDTVTLAKGLWLIKIHSSFAFFGTRNLARLSSVYLGDPSTNNAILIPFQHMPSVAQNGEWQGLLMFDNDGWRIGQARDITVALDEITITSSISCFRVL